MKHEILENRLIDFTISTSLVCEKLSNSEFGINLARQMIRSSISPALNYGEARGAESKRDFIHKLRLSLKELRETYVSLKIVKKAGLCDDSNSLNKCLDECNQLISIFVVSIRTAENKSHSSESTL